MKKDYSRLNVVTILTAAEDGFLTASVVEIDSAEVSVEDYKSGFTDSLGNDSSFEVTFE